MPSANMKRFYGFTFSNTFNKFVMDIRCMHALFNDLCVVSEFEWL